jgi:5'-nucleotidase
MQDPIQHRLVVGVSSQALFDLGAEAEDQTAREEHRRHAIQRDGEVLAPGRAFPVVQALQRLGERSSLRVDLVVLSRASADASPRLFASMHEHALHVAQAAFTGGEPFGAYLAAFHVNLLLSENEEDARAATLAGTPAAVVTVRPEDAKQPIDQIRIAFDGDAALFGRAPGADADLDDARPEGLEKPRAQLLRALAQLQAGDGEKRPVRTALLTRRASPAQERVLKAMREANVRLDEALFVGDLPREELLGAFRAHLLFEDGGAHFRIPEEIVKADLHATKAEVPTVSTSPFARLRLRNG